MLFHAYNKLFLFCLSATTSCHVMFCCHLWYITLYSTHNLHLVHITPIIVLLGFWDFTHASVCLGSIAILPSGKRHHGVVPPASTRNRLPLTHLSRWSGSAELDYLQTDTLTPCRKNVITQKSLNLIHTITTDGKFNALKLLLHHGVNYTADVTLQNICHKKIKVVNPKLLR